MYFFVVSLVVNKSYNFINISSSMSEYEKTFNQVPKLLCHSNMYIQDESVYYLSQVRQKNVSTTIAIS